MEVGKASTHHYIMYHGVKFKESKNEISDPARCSYSGGARGVGGLTCGLELELELSDRIGVKKWKMTWKMSDRTSVRVLENKLMVSGWCHL